MIYLLVFSLATILVRLSTVAAADVETPFPVFDGTKCVKKNGVMCFLALDVNGEKNIEKYSRDEDADGQLMFRIFNSKKMLVDVWVGGPSVILGQKDSDRNLLNCSETNGEVKLAKTELSTLVNGRYSDGKLYCRIILESKGNSEIFPATISGDVKLIFGVKADQPDQPEEYITSRAVFTSLLQVGSCSVDWSRKSLVVEKGFRILPIPDDHIFTTSITCPKGTLAVSYKEVTGKKKLVSLEAMDMTCKKDTDDADKFKWFITGADGKELEGGDGKPAPVSPDVIKYAGCKYRECEMCKEVTTLPCQAEGCKQPLMMKHEGGCDVLKCDKSWILLNDDPKPHHGGLNCTAISPNDKPRWAYGSIAVEKASCLAEISCHVTSPLKCVNDANCARLSFTKEGEKQGANCSDSGATMFVKDGGNETKIKNLVCSQDTGFYKMFVGDGEDKPLPADALIDCQGGGTTTTSRPQAASSLGLYVGCGFGFVLLIIAVLVGVWCCVKRKKKAGRSSTSKQPATTQTTTQTTKSKETTRSKETTTRSKETTRSNEKQTSTTPATTATTTPQTPFAVTGLGGHDESHVEPQRTPFFMSPLKEAPTQDHKEKSDGSAPIRPTPGQTAPYPPPRPKHAEDPVPSVKQFRDFEGNVIHVAYPEDDDEDVHQPPDSAPKKKAKRKPKKSSKTRTTSVKRTQESSTKRTQNTQHTRSTNRAPRDGDEDEEEDGGKAKPDPNAEPKEEPPKPKGGRAVDKKKGAKPKKVQYSALNAIPDDEESSKDENEKKRLAQPFATPSREKVDNDYVGLDKVMMEGGATPEQVKELGRKAELAKSKTSEDKDDKNLVTQKSTEEDKDKKK